MTRQGVITEHLDSGQDYYYYYTTTIPITVTISISITSTITEKWLRPGAEWPRRCFLSPSVARTLCAYASRKSGEPDRGADPSLRAHACWMPLRICFEVIRLQLWDALVFARYA